MKVEKCFDLYINSNTAIEQTSIRTYRGKIKKFTKMFAGKDIQFAIREENLRTFIFDTDQMCEGKYSALYNYYEFIHKELFNNSGNIAFPIDKNEVLEEDEKRRSNSKGNKDKKGKSVFYLDKGFDFSILFKDEYYHHLNDEKANITIKAAISLCLGAGYDSGVLFSDNSNKGIKLKDLNVDDDKVIVKNFSKNSTVPWITITGEYADYITDYYNLRINSDKKLKDDSLFIQLWNARKLNYSDKIYRRKPYTVFDLMLYVLKYISIEINLEKPLTITDLRSNAILHALYNTKGSALHRIIEMFGYPPYVSSAFEEYCEGISNTTYFGLTPSNNSSDDFLSEASSDDEIDENYSTDEANPIEFTLLQSIIRKRDSKKVHSLKSIYDNRCQVCGDSFTVIDEIKYSEVHHLQPHGQEHKGLDDYPNMIVLCPNHHKLFDLGIIAIDPENLSQIICIDPTHTSHNSQLKIIKHDIDLTCIKYHFEYIFKPLKNEYILLSSKLRK